MATHFSIFAWRIPVDRGAWWATVHGVTESDTTEHVCTIIEFQLYKKSELYFFNFQIKIFLTIRLSRSFQTIFKAF